MRMNECRADRIAFSLIFFSFENELQIVLRFVYGALRTIRAPKVCSSPIR